MALLILEQFPEVINQINFDGENGLFYAFKHDNRDIINAIYQMNKILFQSLEFTIEELQKENKKLRDKN